MNFDEERLKHGINIEEITIRTHVPEKWRFIDLETGHIWKWDFNPNRDWPHRGFIKADEEDIYLIEKVFGI